MTRPHELQPLSIAILGTRGVPPRYGGFETFAAELSTRLVARGHALTVYCRRSLYSGEPGLWRGVRRIELPSARHKYLDTVSHAFASTVDAVRRSFDVILLCNAANAFVLPLLGAARIPAAINVDGIERNRRKWNWLGRMVYFAGEALSATLADALVADARVIAAYYRERFGINPEMIPYGSEFPDEPDSDILGRLGIEPERFLLYVSRFEPENNPLEVAKAYRNAPGSLPLVMVGAAPYAPELLEAVRSAADSRVILPGSLYGADYRTLQRRAFAYIQATEVGGTHPAMIEAMAANGAVLANDTPENREVGGDAVRYFRFHPEETLSRAIRECIDVPAGTAVYRSKARARARAEYGWERVVDAYETLFRRLTGQV